MEWKGIQSSAGAGHLQFTRKSIQNQYRGKFQSMVQVVANATGTTVGICSAWELQKLFNSNEILPVEVY